MRLGRAFQREWFYTPNTLSLRKDGSLWEVAFCLCDERPEHITIEKTKDVCVDFIHSCIQLFNLF